MKGKNLYQRGFFERDSKHSQGLATESKRSSIAEQGS